MAVQIDRIEVLTRCIHGGSSSHSEGRAADPVRPPNVLEPPACNSGTNFRSRLLSGKAYRIALMSPSQRLPLQHATLEL